MSTASWNVVRYTRNHRRRDEEMKSNRRHRNQKPTPLLDSIITKIATREPLVATVKETTTAKATSNLPGNEPVHEKMSESLNQVNQKQQSSLLSASSSSASSSVKSIKIAQADESTIKSICITDSAPVMSCNRMKLFESYTDTSVITFEMMARDVLRRLMSLTMLSKTTDDVTAFTLNPFYRIELYAQWPYSPQTINNIIDALVQAKWLKTVGFDQYMLNL